MKRKDIHTFDIEMTLVVPASSKGSAREMIEDWEKKYQEGVGGFSFEITDITNKDAKR